MDSKPKSVKLYYFDSTGRAEAIRLCLTLAEIKFEDIRLTQEQFADLSKKNFFKFGAVPVIEVDGKQYAESMAIAMYAAKLAKINQTNALDILVHEQAIEAQKDLFEGMIPIFHEQDAKKKQELMKSYIENDLPFWLGQIDNLLKENGSNGHFVGNSISLADINMFCLVKMFCTGMMGLPTDVKEKYSNIKKLSEKVEGTPAIKAYYEKKK
eukprot:TRINITY_DN4066_c0_g1_i3.p1 TRINITY_DN4066_c0_g1~~TRINITY_DN4066_c0_g1_i3.p1  ORF type:complete len:211 (-),score=53.66 TRINITY_DN4066_c0_g1_i3:386-1018(-)